MKIAQLIKSELQQLRTVTELVGESDQQNIEKILRLFEKALKTKKKILIAGNGGSAAEAQHFSAELVGRYKKERIALPSIAFTTDTSILTAIGNDYGYEKVFERQLAALGQPGDILVLLSTSGNSQNLLGLIALAKKQKIRTCALLGKNGGALRGTCDVEYIAPSDNTARIQEIHLFLIHLICEHIDSLY
ncbi:MAG: phosphoheptose isomerase [Candidatus Kaiserbacteria bacterium]|nr:phosphoheptose isomerase [Candidatus Kaiserbacteria bacterium]